MKDKEQQHRRVCAYVDLDAIVWNLEQIHANVAEQTQVVAVVKADGYGHGAVPIARKVEHLPYIWGFACATVEEGVSLREAGIQKPVLILGYTFEEHYDIMCSMDIIPVVFETDMAKKMSDTAVKLGKKMEVHLAVDTGMGRIGFRDDESSIPDCVEISKMPGILISGLFTHFARADEWDSTPAKRQMERYLHFVGLLEAAGIRIPYKHCSNSAGIMNLPEANMDLVRAGIILYGLFPSDQVYTDKIKLKPAMSLKSHVVYVKGIEPGTPVSYGGTYVAEKPRRVATIPVGYGDGYPRSLSNKGYVLIHGKRADIIGRVCMDQFMVDVTDIPDVKTGDEVTLIGTDGGETITIENMGDISGRFNYEFACDLGKRIPRVYL